MQNWHGGQESLAPGSWADTASAAVAVPDADAVRRLRISQSLTVEAVCEAAGISKSTLHHFENGQTRGRKSTVCALAAVYGVTPDELYRAWQQARAAAVLQLAELRRDRRHRGRRHKALRPAESASSVQLMSIGEVSAFAGVSVEQVAIWADTGKISRIERADGQHLYRASEVQFLADLENAADHELPRQA